MSLRSGYARVARGGPGLREAPGMATPPGPKTVRGASASTRLVFYRRYDKWLFDVGYDMLSYVRVARSTAPGGRVRQKYTLGCVRRPSTSQQSANFAGSSNASCRDRQLRNAPALSHASRLSRRAGCRSRGDRG
ncbi:uncharacterized protein LOC112590627 [Harpegnathos saltator]|uniref:uncharacterized protein LOC112590627 n=1 Tax=Harpegnathos saltator TaxID=610380 RepID=UPI000DBED6EE|nr:uncharacterized protein LOC112590627 [Harpegnathos saltator]